MLMKQHVACNTLIFSVRDHNFHSSSYIFNKLHCVNVMILICHNSFIAYSVCVCESSSLTKSLALFHFHVVPRIGAIIPRGRANRVQIDGLNPHGFDLVKI